MGFEGLHGNKVVKGAPFSATAATETTQTLAGRDVDPSFDDQHALPRRPRAFAQ